jgi:hypothetical protein
LSHSWLLDAHMTVILSSVILSKLHTDILSSVHDCLKIICSWEAIRMMRPIETCAAWNSTPCPPNSFSKCGPLTRLQTEMLLHHPEMCE